LVAPNGVAVPLDRDRYDLEDDRYDLEDDRYDLEDDVRPARHEVSDDPFPEFDPHVVRDSPRDTDGFLLTARLTSGPGGRRQQAGEDGRHGRHGRSP